MERRTGKKDQTTLIVHSDGSLFIDQLQSARIALYG